MYPSLSLRGTGRCLPKSDSRAWSAKWVVRRLACFPVFRITSSWPTSHRSKPGGTWEMLHAVHGPHHGQHGRGHFPVDCDQEGTATCCCGSLPGSCAVFLEPGLRGHRRVCSDSPGQMWLLCSALGKASGWPPGSRHVCLHALHISCPQGSEMHFY